MKWYNNDMRALGHFPNHSLHARLKTLENYSTFGWPNALAEITTSDTISVPAGVSVYIPAFILVTQVPAGYATTSLGGTVLSLQSDLIGKTEYVVEVHLVNLGVATTFTTQLVVGFGLNQPGEIAQVVRTIATTTSAQDQAFMARVEGFARVIPGSFGGVPLEWAVRVSHIAGAARDVRRDYSLAKFKTFATLI